MARYIAFCLGLLPLFNDKRQLSRQLLSYCSAWNIGVNVRFHFSSSLSSRHTLLPQIIPYIVKIKYLLAFVWVSSFLFGCFEYQLSFLSIELENLQQSLLISVVGVVVLLFRSNPSLIDHFFLNFNLSYLLNLSLPRNMAQTSLE